MTDVAEAPPGFHARHSARARAYVYRVQVAPLRDPLRALRAYHWPAPLDREALDACAAAIVGRTTSGAFTPAETQHETFVRTVHHCRWREAGDELRLEIARRRVPAPPGADAGRARCSTGASRRRWRELLAGAPRADAGPTAPPCGSIPVGCALRRRP